MTAPMASYLYVHDLDGLYVEHLSDKTMTLVMTQHEGEAFYLTLFPATSFALERWGQRFRRLPGLPGLAPEHPRMAISQHGVPGKVEVQAKWHASGTAEPYGTLHLSFAEDGSAPALEIMAFTPSRTLLDMLAGALGAFGSVVHQL